MFSLLLEIIGSADEAHFVQIVLLLVGQVIVVLVADEALVHGDTALDAVFDEGEIIPDAIVDDVVIFGCDVNQCPHPDDAVCVVIAFQNDMVITRPVIVDQLVRGEDFAQYDDGKMM